MSLFHTAHQKTCNPELHDETNMRSYIAPFCTFHIHLILPLHRTRDFFFHEPRLNSILALFFFIKNKTKQKHYFLSVARLAFHKSF